MNDHSLKYDGHDDDGCDCDRDGGGHIILRHAHVNGHDHACVHGHGGHAS